MTIKCSKLLSIQLITILTNDKCILYYSNPLLIRPPFLQWKKLSYKRGSLWVKKGGGGYISAILLVEEISIPGENHLLATSHLQTLSHNVVSSTPCLSGIRTHNAGGLWWEGPYKRGTTVQWTLVFRNHLYHQSSLLHT